MDYGAGWEEWWKYKAKTTGKAGYKEGHLAKAGYVEASEAEVKTRLGQGWEGHMEAGGHMPVTGLRGWSEVLQFE